MPNLISWSQGKKTYAVCAVAIAAGVYDAIMGHSWPGWVDFFLGLAGFGGGSMRHAIETRSEAATEAVQALAQAILSNVTAPNTSGAGVVLDAKERASLEAVSKGK